MSKVIDIDARAGSFEPVVVKFRGEEHVLGKSAAQLLGVTAVYKEYPQEKGEAEMQYALRLAIPLLRALSAEIAATLDAQPLSAQEELAFLPVLTEVVTRVGKIRFRPDTDE